ncbi:XdhC family protein [Halomonas sp. HP20-15]|uniref:XdhC family protein n=1 Tax=Halomonas sp. HP20-15 TaxID=3085901 RepID=UPI00298258A0|nr:XdhC family protein [Halomonas sp. HP20-15]MDW5378366.1 XdhC family protein [Halomonas sp. HP20-15]
MLDMDVRVLSQALDWARDGHTLWLCTVISTYGSSPRAPGSMLIARGDGGYLGSLSGGCVEETFIEQLQAGAFDAPATIHRYGDSTEEGARLALPCGGVLEVLIERRAPTAEWLAHLQALRDALLGRRKLIRRVALDVGACRLDDDDGRSGARVSHQAGGVSIRVGPVVRLILAGISPVAEACARFARELGYEVIVCDPREEDCREFAVEGVTVEPTLPSLFIAKGACHEATAVLALTHDPRIDDLAMIEAVRTEAFYIGVMGSRKTSDDRATRLARSGGLSDADLARIHMPIGLDLGSKTPAEIALATIADVMRVHHGRARDTR